MSSVRGAFLAPDLQRRSLRPELMDDPSLDAERHAEALSALRTVNALSGAAGRTWRAVRAFGLARDRPVRVLDVACGGGDVVVALGLRAAAGGLPLEIHGCDRSPVALAYARRQAESRRAPVSFFPLDVNADELPTGYDLVCSSLFLHHLTVPACVSLLQRMARVAEGIFVQDLRRTRLGYLLALVTLRTLTRSDVARVDGLRSVAGAFTLAEVADLADLAGLEGAEVRPCWPQRFTLAWRRP